MRILFGLRDISSELRQLKVQMSNKQDIGFENTQRSRTSTSFMPAVMADAAIAGPKRELVAQTPMRDVSPQTPLRQAPPQTPNN